MLSLLLENKKKKLKAKTPSKKSKGKQKKGESSSSTNTEDKEHSNSQPSKPPSKEEVNSKNGSAHSKRMSKLEQRLEALVNRKGLQEVGVVRPYLVEWDLVPYPPKFKALTLQTFNGTNTYTTSSFRPGI